MNNEELIYSLRYCFEKRKTVVGVPWYVWCDRAADALEADEHLLDLNTERCEDLRKQLRESHESYEKHINELEAQLPKECEFKRYADKMPNARNRYCTQCGAYLSDEEFENHSIRYCYWCGSKVKGEHDESV